MSTKITPNDATLPNVNQLHGKFNELQERAIKVSKSFQTVIPLTRRSKPAQQAFLLAFADIKLLEGLLESAERTFNGIAVAESSPEQLSDVDKFLGSLAELAKDLIDSLVEQFGVAEDVVIPATLIDLGRQVELIETLVVRLEADAAVVLG